MINRFIKCFVFVLCLATAVHSPAQSPAYVQFINTSADPSIDTIDLYIDGVYQDSNLVLNSVYGFLADTAGNAYTFEIQKKHSYGIFNPDSTILSASTGLLTNNQLCEMILSGLNSTGFAANPNSVSTVLQFVLVNKDSATAAGDTGHVTLKFYNGVTDIPQIDIVDRLTGTTYASALKYGDTSSTILPHYAAFEFQLIDHNTQQNYGTYIADLSSEPNYGGQSVFVFASGFLNPSANDSGPNIALFGVLNNGAVIPFPVDTANFQILNNCADSSADSLNIYINGQLVFPKLAFRNATPQFNVKAFTTYNFAIALKTDTSASEAFWQQSFLFGPDSFHIAAISGLKNSTGYAPNPDGISTAFNVIIKSPAELTGSSQQNFDFYFLNGATDAPALDIIPAGGPPIITNIPYADQSNYVSLPSISSGLYTLGLEDTSGNSLGNYFADFLGFPAQSGVVLTSGFLNPANNNNGPSLGMYMVPIAGGPFFPLFMTTRVHEISNQLSTSIFPNPSANDLFIRFKQAQSGNAVVEITDLNGKVLRQLANGNSESGETTIHTTVSDFSEGVYLVRIITSDGTAYSRLVIAR